MMGVMEDVDVHQGFDDDDSDLTWAEALAEFEAGEPVRLERPARKLAIRYRYVDRRFFATSPDLTGFEVSGSSLDETRRLVREDLERFLDEHVELDERFPSTTQTAGLSNSRITHGDQFVVPMRSASRAMARVFHSGPRLKAS